MGFCGHSDESFGSVTDREFLGLQTFIAQIIHLQEVLIPCPYTGHKQININYYNIILLIILSIYSVSKLPDTTATTSYVSAHTTIIIQC